MAAELHTIRISGGALCRGFWLYVWDIRIRDGRQLLYVGRTGDSSSLNAQSPFGRLSQHLGRNPRANALIKHLTSRSISLEDCESLEMTAYGPLLPEARDDKAVHQHNRDHVAALEKELAVRLRDHGYEVINQVQSLKPLYNQGWREVAEAFAKKFDRLQQALN